MLHAAWRQIRFSAGLTRLEIDQRPDFGAALAGQIVLYITTYCCFSDADAYTRSFCEAGGCLDSDNLVSVLEELPEGARRAFAARAVLRALPCLISATHKIRGPFGYWENTARNKHLLAAFSAAHIAYICACEAHQEITGAIMDSFAEAAHFAAIDSNHAMAEDILVATYYAAYAGISADTHFAANAVIAANAAAKISFYYTAPGAIELIYFDFKKYVTEQISSDLLFLQHNPDSIKEFLRQPLWTIAAPAEWAKLVNRFKTAVLSLKAGFEIWLDWYTQIEKGEQVDLSLMAKAFLLPQEITAQGAAAINAYLIGLRDGSIFQPLNRVRAIFIGYGGAGKTSLVRVLHKEPVREGKEPMTPGIEIRRWRVPGSQIEAHLWDFAGQVMTHATHKLFLRSSCLYVLVINARKEISANEQAEYWLDHVKSFGANAPVMIVGNCLDQASLNFDMAALQEKYENVVGFFPLSCTQAQGAYQSHSAAFETAFCQQLQQLSQHQIMFDEAQFAVMQRLQELTPQQSFLSKKFFDDLCDDKKLPLAGRHKRSDFLDLLDKLGIILHFPQLPFIDGYILNPRWLTYGVYHLMCAHQSQLGTRDAIRLLQQETVQDEYGNTLDYPPEKCQLIMAAMHEFKLAYWVSSRHETLIIPEHLPATQPQHGFEKDTALAFEFAFAAFLPRHLLPQLIVERHQEIVADLVWQNGVILGSNAMAAQALLQVDYHLRRLSIWVNGNQARDYLTVLRDALGRILQELDIDYKEWIELPAAARLDNTGLRAPMPGREKAPYRQLLSFAAHQIDTYATESGTTYSVAKVLGYIMTADKQKREMTQLIQGHHINLFTGTGASMSKQENTIIGSTIHGNVIAAKTIRDSFTTLAQSTAAPDLKAVLEKLLQEVEALQAKATTPEQQIQASNLLTDTSTLINESASPAPRKRLLQVSLEGLRDAAQAIGEIGKSVLETAQLITPLLPG